MTQYYVWDKSVGRTTTSSQSEKYLNWTARLQGDTAIEVAQSANQLLDIQRATPPSSAGKGGAGRGRKKALEGGESTPAKPGAKAKTLKQQVAAWCSYGEEAMNRLSEALKQMKGKEPLHDLEKILLSKQPAMQAAYTALKTKEVLINPKDINKQQQPQQQRTAATTPATTN